MISFPRSSFAHLSAITNDESADVGAELIRTMMMMTRFALSSNHFFALLCVSSSFIPSVSRLDLP